MNLIEIWMRAYNYRALGRFATPIDTAKRQTKIFQAASQIAVPLATPYSRTELMELQFKSTRIGDRSSCRWRRTATLISLYRRRVRDRSYYTADL